MKNRTGLFGLASVALCLQGLAACTSSGGADNIHGIPKTEFNRVFAVAIEVGSAEHCGDPVDAAKIRENLMKFETNKGLTQEQLDKAGQLYDSSNTQFKERIAQDPTYCTRQYKKMPERLAGYANGTFPDVK